MDEARWGSWDGARAYKKWGKRPIVMRQITVTKYKTKYIKRGENHAS
ncbi:hypothetical protein [Bacillus piscicola]|nr:hypothetical protein [Bacillus piscicola]